MDSLPGLVASVPSGDAYVRVVRGTVCYVGGPYATDELARQSAGRLVCDMPDVTSIAILGRPQVAAPTDDQRWYARATFVADGYTAIAGPFGSWREARSDLMGLADRGQIGAWHEWSIDYHEVTETRPPRRQRLTRAAPWRHPMSLARSSRAADAFRAEPTLDEKQRSCGPLDRGRRPSRYPARGPAPGRRHTLGRVAG